MKENYRLYLIAPIIGIFILEALVYWEYGWKTWVLFVETAIVGYLSVALSNAFAKIFSDKQ